MTEPSSMMQLRIRNHRPSSTTTTSTSFKSPSLNHSVPQQLLPITTTTKLSSSSSAVRIVWKWVLRCGTVFFFLFGLMSASILLLYSLSKYPITSTTSTTSTTTKIRDTRVQLTEDYSAIFDVTVPSSSSSSSSSSHNSHNENHRVTTIKTQYQPPSQRISPPVPEEDRSPDGYFNGGPIYQQRKKLSDIASYAHCVGETYQPSKVAWKDKSCHFQFLCYNTSSYEYIVFESPQARFLARNLALRPFAHVSDNLHRHNHSDTISLGGINLKWGNAGIARLRWFPKIIPLPSYEIGQQRELVYYELPQNTVMIPYHSLNGANPGHLVWDDFLPIYTLLGMFQLLHHPSDGTQRPTKYNLLPIRHVLQDGERGLWASCDSRDDKTVACQHMISKFWPLLTGINHTYVPTTNIQPLFEENKPGTSKLVCSPHGVAGMGSLTDHGLYKAHGWEQSDYTSVHNHGRGEQLYQFRNFMLHNVHIDPYYNLNTPYVADAAPVTTTSSSSSAASRLLEEEKEDALPKYRIVFSQKSSDIFARSLDFETQIQIVQDRFPNVSVEHYVMKNLTLLEQLELTSRTSIYITLCGGGAVSAMFLPKGASVILYYSEDGGTRNGKRSYQPALLDYDLFNAMSYLRVHWLPRNTMKTTFDQDALVLLIEQELHIIQSQVFM